MNTETQNLQEEINSMSLVELLDTEIKLNKGNLTKDCPALILLVHKRLIELDAIGFTLLGENQDHISQQRNV